ncbi:MAG: hypothetical protein R3A47_01660 [Polyangiales bacterium]
MTLAIALSSCSALGLPGSKIGELLKPLAPKISVSGVRMAAMPSAKSLASFYCGEYLGPLICRAFGTVPSVNDMNFSFDVELGFQNPNRIPLPVVSTLFGFKAFPEATDVQNLGAVCLSLCENQDSCQQDAHACDSNEPQIKSASDFAGAAVGFLQSVALKEQKFSDLRVRTIPANESTAMVVRLGLSPVQIVNLIRKFAKGEIRNLKNGSTPQFNIPYSLEGSAWVNVESFGRLASSFGPVDGQFDLL